MLIVDGKTIQFSRGDDITLNFSCKDINNNDYVFSVGDTVQFRIFDKNGYDDEAILSKEISIDEETTIVPIHLLSEDTMIGEEINSKKTYWYEISINEDNTVIGYDNAGPAILYLLPAREES